MRTPGTAFADRTGFPASGTRAYARPYAGCTGRGCAGRFLAPAGISFGPDLVRVTRDLFFADADAFFPAAVVIAVPVLARRRGFEAVRAEGSEWAGSAISKPNRAATSLSSSIFAAFGGALVSVRSCPAPAINSFS